jgi:hypothetical protein
MADGLQMVCLSGGSFDGQLAMAPPPPGALRLYAEVRDEEWREEERSELYLYDGKTFSHPEHGTLPVMLCSERKDIDY